MEKEIEKIFDKMKAVIDTSNIEHKQIVDRYLSLANRRIRFLSVPENIWGIIGACMGTHERTIKKFGSFNYESKPIIL